MSYLVNPYMVAASADPIMWKELDRVSGASNDIMDTGVFTPTPYLMILNNSVGESGTLSGSDLRFNGGVGGNYSRRYSTDGGTDATGINEAMLGGTGTTNTDGEQWLVWYLDNFASDEKTQIAHTMFQTGTGGGNVPSSREVVGKWAESTNDIERIEVINNGGGDFSSDSEVIVLGSDPTNTDTTGGFWEELASVDLSGGTADNLSSGTITGKKYLWIQIFAEADGGAAVSNVRFNGDTALNNKYPTRHQNNGGASYALTNRNEIEPYQAAAIATGTTQFVDMLVTNISDVEKMIIGHTVKQNTAGSGTCPDRNEFYSKWVDTSTQITEIDVQNNDSGSLATTTTLKVWGSD